MLARFEGDGFYHWHSDHGATVDQLVVCFEGLKDPRTGKAGLHDLQFVALRTVLSGGQGRPVWRGSRQRGIRSCAATSSLRTVSLLFLRETPRKLRATPRPLDYFVSVRTALPIKPY